MSTEYIRKHEEEIRNVRRLREWREKLHNRGTQLPASVALRLADMIADTRPIMCEELRRAASRKQGGR